MNELFEQSYISTSTYPKRTMKTEKELLSIHMRSKLNEWHIFYVKLKIWTRTKLEE